MELIQYFIRNYSTGCVLLLFLVFFGLISILTTFILQKYYPNSVINKADANQAASIFFGTFTGFYALLLAFIIVLLWSNIDNNHRLILEESTELSNLTRLSNTLNTPTKTKIRSAIKEYINAIITVEWDDFQTHNVDSFTETKLNNLFENILEISAQNDNERIIYNELISLTEQLVATHRQRVAQAIGETLPAAILYTILFGGLIISILISLIGGVSKAHQYILHVVVSLFIAINIGLIFVLNSPYSLHLFSKKPYSTGILKIYNIDTD